MSPIVSGNEEAVHYQKLISIKDLFHLLHSHQQLSVSHPVVVDDFVGRISLENNSESYETFITDVAKFILKYMEPDLDQHRQQSEIMSIKDKILYCRLYEKPITLFTCYHLN